MSVCGDVRSPSSGSGTPGLLAPGSHLSTDNLSEAGKFFVLVVLYFKIIIFRIRIIIINDLWLESLFCHATQLLYLNAQHGWEEIHRTWVKIYDHIKQTLQKVMIEFHQRSQHQNLKHLQTSKKNVKHIQYDWHLYIVKHAIISWGHNCMLPCKNIFKRHFVIQHKLCSIGTRGMLWIHKMMVLKTSIRFVQCFWSHFSVLLLSTQLSVINVRNSFPRLFFVWPREKINPRKLESKVICLKSRPFSGI